MAETSRRDFLAHILAGGASAGLAGCGVNNPGDSVTAVEPASSQNELISALQASNSRFIDVNGEEVNLAGLEGRLGGNYSTLSFQFAGCMDQCPITGGALAEVSKSTPGIKHVVLSLSPKADFQGVHIKEPPIDVPTLAEKLEAQGLRVKGPGANTIILFPTTDGTSSEAGLSGGNKAGFEIQHAGGLITGGNTDVRFHSGAITLFSAGGKQLKQVLGQDSATIATEFNQFIAAQHHP